MSLFGDENTPPSDSPLTRNNGRPSMFDDDKRPGQSNPQPSLFDDEHHDSPWDFPAPRSARPRRGSAVIRTLLTAENAKIPQEYWDYFDSLAEAYSTGSGNVVGVDAIDRVFSEAGVAADARDAIWKILGERKESWTREEVWAVIAMVGLVIEGDDLGLDSVDDRRRDLPVPLLKGLQRPGKPAPSNESIRPSSGNSSGASNRTIPDRTTMTSPSTFAPPSPPRQQPMFKPQSLPEDDPWGAPSNTSTHPTVTTGILGPTVGPTPGLRSATTAPTNPDPKDNLHRTISALSDTEPDDLRAALSRGPAPRSNTWGDFGVPAIEENGFAATGERSSINGGFGSARPHIRSAASVGGTPTAEETVNIQVLPEKEGVFMFQHRNYQVTSVRRNVRVVRRYSDFVWLLECLHKRYPFRALPLLPPKALTVNATPLLASTSFLDRRRRGLIRFSNFLVRHPILSKEQLVVMFFTVPTELAVWRKQANLSLTDEFDTRTLPPTLEPSLPPDLLSLFETVRSGVKKSAELYISLCALLDRLIKRNEGLSQDYHRLTILLNSLTDLSDATYAVDNNECPLLNDGLNTVATSYTQARQLLEEEARAWEEGVLEDLKRQRDALVGMRELFDRKDRLSADNRLTLEKRIQANTKKLNTPRPQPMPEVERVKLEEAIKKDRLEIVKLKERQVWIKATVLEEVRIFKGTVYQVGRLHREWGRERVKFAELGGGVWRGMCEGLEGMPEEG
ncbi:hypothetical protein BJ508DRAFT_215102 [Ascobolus immersus RN42]|uniref:Sorting nexin MVP1 n=1 Tax=Ascobolus immersus RN42 TaxID=1160509 RepID=A0A3N4HRT9_ASCIM|nr:hypothetical protein BJ508DRAFT_215102 [Ascobolus immersus RN42]